MRVVSLAAEWNKVLFYSAARGRSSDISLHLSGDRNWVTDVGLSKERSYARDKKRVKNGLADLTDQMLPGFLGHSTICWVCGTLGHNKLSKMALINLYLRLEYTYLTVSLFIMSFLFDYKYFFI